MSTKDKLIRKLQDKTAKISILGLGYVGLPLAVVFADAGFDVIGIEVDSCKVEMLNKGESYIRDVTTAQIEALVRAGRLKSTTDFSVLKDVNAASICVPAPLRKTGDPDLSFIVSATESLARYVHPGMV